MQKLICLMLAYITLLTVLVGCSDEPEGFDDPIGEANNTISTADPKFGGRYKLYWYDLPSGTEYPAEEGAIDISHNEFEYRDAASYLVMNGELFIRKDTGKLIEYSGFGTQLTTEMACFDAEGNYVIPVYQNKRERNYSVLTVKSQSPVYEVVNGKQVAVKGEYQYTDSDRLTPDEAGVLRLMRISPETLTYELFDLEFLPTEQASQERLVVFGSTADGGFYGIFLERYVEPILDIHTAEMPALSFSDYTFAIWDQNGRRTATIPLETLTDCMPDPYIAPGLIYHGTDNGYIYVGDVYVGSNGIFFVKTSQVSVFTGSGDYLYRIQLGSNKLAADADGNIVVTGTAPYNGKTRYTTQNFSHNLRMLTSGKVLPTMVTNVPTLAAGYDAYLVNSLGIKAGNLDEKALTLLEWDEYDLRYGDIDEVKVIDPDTVFFTVTDPETELPRLGLLTTAEIDGMEAARVTRKRTVITLAYVADKITGLTSPIENYISAFNDENKQYKIKSVYYETDGTLSANNELIRDIMTGTIPDMILFGSGIAPESFAGLGILRNLYEFMAGDETYTKDAFLPCVLEPFETADGELPYLTLRYYLNTVTSAGNPVASDSWSVSDMLAFTKSIKKGEYLSSYAAMGSFNPSDRLLAQLIPNIVGSFIDYENETADFGNNLAGLLELCKAAPILTETPSSPQLYSDGTIKLKIYSYKSPTEFLLDRYGYYNGVNIAYPGYPGNGTVIRPMQSLAVTNDCEVPEGAWEFMKFCLDRIDAEWDYVEPTEKDGKYVDNVDLIAPKGFSGVKATVEKMFETLKHYYYFATLTETSLMPGVVMLSASSLAYHYDKDGTCRDVHAKYENQSTAVMYTLTDEDAAAFMALLDGVTAVQSSDEALMDIIYEDAQYYFNGMKSIEETVRIIENRVGIKLAE